MLINACRKTSDAAAGSRTAGQAERKNALTTGKGKDIYMEKEKKDNSFMIRLATLIVDKR